MAILKIKDNNGNFVDILSIVGPAGPQGPVGPAGAINFTVVVDLPTENIDESCIYLKPVNSSNGDNLYEEFIYVNGVWESLGTPNVQVDLSNYYKKDESMGNIIVDDITPNSTTQFGYTSGSNENGYYVKFSDGSLICKGRFTIPASTASLTLTMPYAFIAGSSTDIVVTNRYTNSKTIVMSANMGSATTAIIHPIDVKTGNTPTVESSGCFIAMGRWK